LAKGHPFYYPQCLFSSLFQGHAECNVHKNIHRFIAFSSSEKFVLSISSDLLMMTTSSFPQVVPVSKLLGKAAIDGVKKLLVSTARKLSPQRKFFHYLARKFN